MIGIENALYPYLELAKLHCECSEPWFNRTTNKVVFRFNGMACRVAMDYTTISLYAMTNIQYFDIMTDSSRSPEEWFKLFLEEIS